MSILEPSVSTLRDDFRKAENKHADESTWSNDGQNGYAWGFFTENTSLYVFKGTRSSVVPKEVFGDGEHIYDEESVRIRDELLAICASDVKDGKLKGYFDLMSEKRHRFFQWVRNPGIEAENNLAERRLRPLVTARKVCFGSQSEKGLEVREILMSIIDSLSLRFNDPVAKLSSVLDEIGRNKNADVDALLWRNAN